MCCTNRSSDPLNSICITIICKYCGPKMIFISRIHKREEEEKKMVLQKVWYPDGHPAGSLTRFSTKVQTTVSVPPKPTLAALDYQCKVLCSGLQTKAAPHPSD
jgi:hypothetical protein